MNTDMKTNLKTKIKMNTKLTTSIKTILYGMGLALLASTAQADTHNHAMMNHEQPSQMQHSSMKHDAMTHDSMKHSKMQHGAMNHNQMAHQGMNHDMPAKHSKFTPESSLAMLKAQGFYAGSHHGMEHNDHDDDPFLTKVLIDQLEVRRANGETTTVLEAEAWAGTTLKKLWFVVDAERHESELEELKLSLHYGRAVSAYWDVIAGVRQDIKPDKTTWGVVGLKGLAPYFFDTDATLAVNKDGVVHANLTAEYEAMLTQKWVLSPEFAVNAYSKATDEAGKGISDASLGLRLRYEIKREFAPYVGVVSTWKLGNTADMARDEGKDTRTTQVVLGVHAWF